MRLMLLLCFCARTSLADGVLPPQIKDSDYRPVTVAEAALGQLLFYDRILSGNRNIACSTCHNPRFATTDGVSLGLGEGAEGFGPERHAAAADIPRRRIPRNTPALFNLGAYEFRALFADGRVAEDPSRRSGLLTPLPDRLTPDFASVLAAQTMFPMLSDDEMAGHDDENDVAMAVRDGIITGKDGALDIIAKRVSAIPGYRKLFADAYPAIGAGREIRFSDISNALAAFVGYQWRSDASPFDSALRGMASLPPDAEAGRVLFYGGAGCSRCHSGRFQTDQSFHSTGQPQLGPGKPVAPDRTTRDLGRSLVTGDAKDNYRFRTPSLRNVIRTGPWGHAGAYSDLTAFLGQHSKPATGMDDYADQAVLPDLPGHADDWAVRHTPDQAAAIGSAAEADGPPLSGPQIAEIIAFLQSLTDESAVRGRLKAPAHVPSGLDVDP